MFKKLPVTYKSIKTRRNLRAQLSSIMSQPTGPDSRWVTMRRLTEESSLLYREHDTSIMGSPTFLHRANTCFTEIQDMITATRLMMHFNRKTTNVTAQLRFKKRFAFLIFAFQLNATSLTCCINMFGKMHQHAKGFPDFIETA